MTSKVVDLRIKHDASLLLVGPSMAGKTQWTRAVLSYRFDDSIFTHPLGNVHWHYGVYYPELEMFKSRDKFILYEGVPINTEHVKPYDCVVLDDLYLESAESKIVTELFTRLTHHRPCFLIVLSHNLYQQSKESKTRQINTKYMVLFQNPRDKGQISVLSRQMYPGKPSYLPDTFTDATKRPYGYLFIDLTQTTPDDFRLRTNILPHEGNLIVYQPRL